MRKAITILLVFCTCYAGAQTLPNFDLIKLEKSSDYKTAEPLVLQTATYLLSTPLKKGDKDRLSGLQFISKWMYGTTDYSFVFTDELDKIGKDNNDILGLYMSAMAKYTLENKSAAKDVKRVKLNAMILLLDYCENKSNNIRMSKQIKKLAEAREKGQLEQSFP